MDRSLLFETSYIFDDSNLVDRIRQSLIDLEVDPPSEEEVQDLLHEAITYIDKDLPINTAVDLFLLISSCFSHYPSQLLPVFTELFKTATSNAYHIIVTSSVISVLTHAQPPLSLPDYHSFVDDSLKQILPQIQNAEEGSLKVFDHEIPIQCRPNLIINLLCASTLTKQLLSDFAPYIFSQKMEQTNSRLNWLVKDISKAGLITVLPESALTNNFLFTKLSPDDLAEIIPNLSEDTFKNVFPRFEEIIIKNKNINSHFSLSFLKKCCDLNMTLGPIGKILDSLSASDLTPQIWDYLKKYDFTLPEKIANEIKEFPDPIFAFKIMPKRENLPQEVLTRALMETTNVHTYEIAFRNANIVCPVLSTPEFWLHILSVYSNSNERSDRFMIPFSRYFQNSVKEENVNEILDKIIFAHSPPQAKDCSFAFLLIYRLSNQYKQIYKSPEHTKSLLQKVAETKMVPSTQFWKLIFQIDPLYQLIQSNPDPVLLFGYSVICRQIARAPLLNTVTVPGQTDASNRDLFDFLTHPQRDMEMNFDLKADMKPEAISLIADALLFTVAQAYRRGRNTDHPQQFIIKGLTKENILPFLAVICEYANTSERRDDILFETFNVFKAPEMISILIEACNYLANNNSPILTTSIDRFLPCLLDFSSQPLYPFILELLKVLVPLLLRNEYMADKKKLMISIIRLSSPGPSSLRRQFGNRDFIFGNRLNQATPQEVNQFFGLYGIDLFEFFIKHLSDIKQKDAIGHLQFNLKVFDATKVAPLIVNSIQSSTSTQDIIDLIHFVDRNCSNVPTLTFENTENITRVLHDSINEKKWNEVMLISQFMKKHNLKKELLTFINEPIQHNIKVTLMADLPIDQVSLDDLLSVLISDPQPETDKLLYDIMFRKLTQDQSIATDYITTLFEKINDKISFTETLLLTLYYKEYQTFGDTFIKSLNRSYTMPSGTTTFILKPECEFMTKPISELGLSLISKLYTIVAEKTDNFQAFVWLRSLAAAFPFLFMDNTEQVFTSILPALDNISLIYTLPQMSEALVKLSPLNNNNNNNNNTEDDNADDNDDENNNDNENEDNNNDNNNNDNNNNNNDNNNNNNDNNNNNANETDNQSEEDKEKLKKEKEQKLKEIEETKNKVKTAVAALEFLISALYSPKVLDDFIVWLFDNMSTFTDSQAFSFILVLRSLYSMKTVQLVLTSFMIKNTFPEIVTSLIERNISEGAFKDDFLSSVYSLTAQYYSLLKSLTPEVVAVVDELQNVEKPFQVTFDHCLTIFPNMQRYHPAQFINLPPDNTQPIGMRDSSRRMISVSHYGQVINFINMIESNVFSNDKDPKRDPTTTIINNFHAHYERLTPPPKPYDGPLPNSISREAFQLLPMKLQSTALFWSLPKVPPQITPKMCRYLVTKPTWATLWIKKIYALLILPEHYGILYNMISDLVKIQKDGTLVEGEEAEPDLNPEDVTLIQYCQGTLFEDLIKQAAGSSRSDHFFVPLCTLFNEISQNGTALISLLEIIAQILNSISSNKSEKDSEKSLKATKRLVHVLKEISKNEGFKENFNDICGNTLLDIACSSENRIHPTLLIQVSELFSILGDDMPNRITQLIGFMFLLDKKKIIPAALNLCSKLSEQKMENIMTLVQKTFDRAINLDKPSPSDIIVFLKKFPAVANARNEQLIKLLRQLLEKFEKTNSENQSPRQMRENTHQKQTLELIGEIFNVLAPRRNQSLSIRMSDSVTVEPTSSSTVQLQRQNSSANVPPYIKDSSPEFWSVYEKYRKLIMQIIQNNILRLSTTFKFLLDYPEITGFQIRSSYFYSQMKKKIKNGTLEFKVRRGNIFADSYSRLRNSKTDELLKRFRVSFIGEPGVDLGGVTRDWFTTLVKEIFNPNYALFIPSANERSNQPNPLSYINEDHINYFRFAGKIIARALIEGLNLDAHLTTSFSKHILHHSVNLRDLEDVDEELHQSLVWMLNNDVEPLDMYFTADTDVLGEHQTVNLKPNGSNIKVTNENKEEFVNLMVERRLKGSIINQVNAFCEGFNSLIPYEDIKRFTPNELDLLICGIPEIDVEDLKRYTEIQEPYNANTPVIKFFFDAISKWDNENLAKLILFMTGSSQVPLNGFKSFKDMNKPITIAPGGGKERLPAAHTCFNRLDLPEYDSEEELNQKLMFAIQECNSFGFV